MPGGSVPFPGYVTGRRRRTHIYVLRAPVDRAGIAGNSHCCHADAAPVGILHTECMLDTDRHHCCRLNAVGSRTARCLLSDISTVLEALVEHPARGRVRLSDHMRYSRRR